MTKIEKISILILIIAVGFTAVLGIINFLTIPDEFTAINAIKEKLLGKETITSISSEKIITLQRVENVGYVFYIGQIDYPGISPISDVTKDNITQIIYKANFPKNLLKSVGIIIVNTLAVSEYEYIKMPEEEISMPSFSPGFMTGGGVYSGKFGKMSLIFINKTKFDSLSEILTHELGHHIGAQLTSEEWKEYYELRGIPSTTSRSGISWGLSPQEDFAEVYRSIFTGSKVRTYYGLLLKSDYLFSEDECGEIYAGLMDNYKKTKYPNADPWSMPWFVTEEEAGITSNAELQDCRRKVLSNPEGYPIDWRFAELFGPPYYNVIDQATKNFVIQIINRLNRD
jgi:hypothetical protein